MFVAGKCQAWIATHPADARNDTMKFFGIIILFPARALCAYNGASGTPHPTRINQVFGQKIRSATFTPSEFFIKSIKSFLPSFFSKKLAGCGTASREKGVRDSVPRKRGAGQRPEKEVWGSAPKEGDSVPPHIFGYSL